jgi:hypothetical protein
MPEGEALRGQEMKLVLLDFEWIFTDYPEYNNNNNNNNSWKRVLLGKIIVPHLVKKFPKGSLSYSEEPATGFYHKPDESSQHPHYLFKNLF